MQSTMKTQDFIVPLVRTGLIVNDVLGFVFVIISHYEWRAAPKVLTIFFGVSLVYHLLSGGLILYDGTRRVKLGRKQGLQAIIIAFGDAVLATSFLISHILTMARASNTWVVSSIVLFAYATFSTVIATLAHTGLSLFYAREASKHFRNNRDLKCPSCHHTFGQSSTRNTTGSNVGYTQVPAKEGSPTIASTSANEDGMTEGDRLITDLGETKNSGRWSLLPTR